jgi:NDP-sugar pyrophosphorylase family protein
MNSIPEGGAGLGALGSAGRFGLRAEPQESFRLFVYTCPSSTFAARASSVSAYKQLNHDLSQDREYTYMPWPAISSDNAAPLVAKSHPPQSVAVNNFSVLGDGVTFAGEGTTVKRTCVARNCRIGARVKLQGCVIMEGVVIEDGSVMHFARIVWCFLFFS